MPTQPAGCMQASCWSGPVLPQSSPCSRRLKSLSETRGPDFPLRSPACPWQILAPTHGTAAIQRLKAVSPFKGATLLFYGFLLPPPPPPFHSVLLNKPDQLLKASEPFQLLSKAGSVPPCFKGRDLGMLGHLCSADASKFGGGHPLGLSAGGLIGWLPRAAPSPAN